MNKDKTKKMLEDEIERNFKELSTIRESDTEKMEAVENLAVLYRLKIDEQKIECENDKKFDRYLKIGTIVAETVLPLIFYAVWMKRGFEFEKEGTYTSTTFRNLFGRFRPTK